MGDITLVKTPWLGLTGTGSHRWVASGRMSAMEPHGCPSLPHEAHVGHTAPSSARPAWVRPELALSKETLRTPKNKITDHGSGNDGLVTEEHCQLGDIRQNDTHMHTHTCALSGRVTL